MIPPMRTTRRSRGMWMPTATLTATTQMAETIVSQALWMLTSPITQTATTPMPSLNRAPPRYVTLWITTATRMLTMMMPAYQTKALGIRTVIQMLMETHRCQPLPAHSPPVTYPIAPTATTPPTPSTPLRQRCATASTTTAPEQPTTRSRGHL